MTPPFWIILALLIVLPSISLVFIFAGDPWVGGSGVFLWLLMIVLGLETVMR